MSTMCHRERVIKAINHEEPDRVPLDLGSWVSSISAVSYNRLTKYLGLDIEGEVSDWIQQTVIPHEEVLKRLGVDIRYVYLGPPKKWKIEKKEVGNYYEIIDEWGITWRMPKKDGFYFDMVKHPLASATIKELEDYPWPDPCDPGLVKGVRERARYLAKQGEYAVVGNFNWESQYERAWYLRGFENFYMDMLLNPNFVHALLEKVCELHMRFLDNILEVCGDYLDIILQGDDLGGQNGPLMSLEAYREFVKPRQKKIFDLIEKKTKAKLFYHCCGSVYPLIDDLLEIGVDILNPIQVSAKGMNTKILKEEYGDRLVFWGGIDTQYILPFGKPEEVVEEVKRRIKELAAGGGYVLSSVHNIQADVPPENIVAMFDAARKYGKYPIEERAAGKTSKSYKTSFSRVSSRFGMD